MCGFKFIATTLELIGKDQIKCNSFRGKPIMIIGMAHRYNRWTDYEDQVLTDLVQQMGSSDWTALARKMRTHYQINKRSGKQCRERWHNCLNRSINRAQWSQQEDHQLLRLQAQYGTRWTELMLHFPGRSDNHIKNHFYALIRKSLRRMCKVVKLKTAALNIYAIKPNTISRIFHRASWTRQPEDEGERGESRAEQFSQITQIVIEYMFDFHPEALHPSEQQKQRVVWALQRMLQINQNYQSEGSEATPDNEERSSGEKMEEEGCREMQANVEEESIGEESNPDGIFSSRRPTAPSQRLTLSTIQSLNLFKGIQPLQPEPEDLPPCMLRLSSLASIDLEPFPDLQVELQQIGTPRCP